MAEQEYVVIYAATYPTVAAARAVLDTIEHPREKVAGSIGLLSAILGVGAVSESVEVKGAWR